MIKKKQETVLCQICKEQKNKRGTVGRNNPRPFSYESMAKASGNPANPDGVNGRTCT